MWDNLNESMNLLEIQTTRCIKLLNLFNLSNERSAPERKIYSVNLATDEPRRDTLVSHYQCELRDSIVS